MNLNETKLKIAGHGGQGVILTGNVIARGCMIENKYVTGMVSYGAEMRGGTANATLVISDSEIASPVVERANMAIILNQPSLERFEHTLMPESTMIINTSLAKTEIQRQDLDIVKIDATNIAKDLGDLRVANIVALGAFIKSTHLLQDLSIQKAIEMLFAKKKKAMIDINLQAFEAGLINAEIVSSGTVNPQQTA